MNNTIRGFGLLLTTSVVMLLAGCVTPGGYGSGSGGYGQPAPGYPSQYGSRLQGTVDSVDPRYNRIFVVVTDQRTGRAQRMEVRHCHRSVGTADLHDLCVSVQGYGPCPKALQPG